MGPLACADCGLLYSDPGWCDVVLRDEDWLAISPTGHHGGVLCLTCMARRLVALGRTDVPMIVTSGPWESDPRDGYWRAAPSWAEWTPPDPRVPVS